MTTINTAFKIGSYNVLAEADFSGRAVNTVITVNGVEIERASGLAADCYDCPFLKGAALQAHDQKWLKDYATNSLMSFVIFSKENQ